jgi:hypothetical protein
MIDAAELAELERCLLPALERHHLRLLAHGLRTFQAVAGRRSGPLPPAAAWAAWAAQQPQLAADASFAASFLEQLTSLASQLEAIARSRSCDPLALELADLSHWAGQQADGRLAITKLKANPAAAPPE